MDGFTWDTDNPLRKAPGESTRSNSALRTYYAMGAGRSLRALLERYVTQATDKGQTEKPPTRHWFTIRGWSVKYEWQARVAAQIALDDALDEATWRQWRKEAIERDWKTGGELLDLAARILAEGPKFLKATTRTIKGRPAKVDAEGRLLDPGEPDQRVTVVALDGQLAVKAADTGSKLARQAAGLDVVRHEVSGPDKGPVQVAQGLTPELAAVIKEAERLILAQSRNTGGDAVGDTLNGNPGTGAVGA